MSAMGQETGIGIDTGGTFTDVVRRAGPRRHTAKVPSTPADPARAVRAGLAAVGGLPAGARLHHGSTVGTNAVLTRTGARVALVTTAGFEDVLHIGRGERDVLHALHCRRTSPLVPRARCLGIDERTGADGRVVRTLAKREVARLIHDLRRTRAEAVAVCLLHSVRSARHERTLARAVARALADGGVRVGASVDLTADGREAERAATAVLDAYVAPRVVEYVARVARSLPPRSLTVMRSDGGRMTPREVRAAPVRTLLSGPAAGVAAAHALALRLALPRALSFDMGGTSTDVAWLEGEDLPVRGELQVGTYRASVPSLPLETVGAGGGSRIWLDTGGALRVGPASAGAEPGPACYGRGGPLALTDAWLLLDRLPPALLGGAFPLDRTAAERAARPLARQAGCAVRALAEGAVAVAAATTARALRRASVARGHDPRAACLVAFGGAGPMLGGETAGLLDVSGVVVPSDPGTFAAEGTLLAPLRIDASRVVTRASPGALRRLAGTLRRDVERRLRAQGAAHLVLRAEVDARYAGQAFEVTVGYDPGWGEAFHAAHAKRYGFADASRSIEVVRLRVRGAGHEVPPGTSARRALPRRSRRRRKADRRALRADLSPGDVLAGPCRVEEMSGTTYAPRGWQARVLEDGTLLLERER